MKNHNYKQLNARIQKWRQMIKFDLRVDPNLLKKRVKKGIPPGIRSIAWPKIINLEQFKKKSKFRYQQLLKKQSISSYDISLDIPRTFPQQKNQILRKSLYNVLKAISLIYPQLGYCQGMNFLAMRLLQIHDDQPAFWIMHYLLSSYDKLLWNYKSPGSVQLQNYVFVQLMKQNLTQIQEILDEQSIIPPLYTTSWFITLFSKSLQKQLFFRIFECFLLQGYRVIYLGVLTLLKYKQKSIKQNSMENNLMQLTDMSSYNGIDIDKFIQKMFEFDINDQKIQNLQNEYKIKNKKNILKMHQQVQLAYKKKLQQYNKNQIIQEQQSIQILLNMSLFRKTPYQLIQLD